MRPGVLVLRKAETVQIEDEYIRYERRRSARFVLVVYAAMALVFSLVAITLANARGSLGLPVETTRLMAGAFVTLAALNLVILEVWQHVFKHRD